MYKFLAVAIALVFLSGCVSTPIDPDDKATWKLVTDIGLPLHEKEWTFIMYFNGDNNLEGQLYEFIAQMAETGSDENLNIVVQTDTITSYLPLGSTTKRLYMEGSPTIVYDIGEQNMGNPMVLSDFINWSVENFPAKKYALILWDHGSASLSTSLDETDDDLLELPELVSALEASPVKFELIGFDMCLFGNIDVDYAISPYAKIRVGSSEVTYNNWDYPGVFEYLKANPNIEGRDVASKFVQRMSFVENFTIGSPEDSLIISAVDLERIQDVKKEFENLVGSLESDIENKWVSMAKAKFSSDKYAIGAQGEGLTELHDFLANLMFFTEDSDVLEAANKTIQKIEEAVIETNAGKNHKNSLGLSFKFIDDTVFYGLFGEEYKERSSFARETGFSNLLEKYNQLQGNYISNIGVYSQQVEYVVNEENPIISIPTNFYGENIVHRYMWVAKDMGEYYDMVFASDIVDFGSSEYVVKSYQSGYNVEEVKWDGMARGANNGKDEIIVFSEPFDVVNDLFFSSGTYSRDLESFEAEIIYNVAEGGKMVEVRAYDSYEDQLLPFLPQVLPSDEFTFNGLKFWKETGKLEPYLGETISFGESGLRRTMVKAPNGEYVILLVVEDITGKRIYDSVDVVVSF